MARLTTPKFSRPVVLLLTIAPFILTPAAAPPAMAAQEPRGALDVEPEDLRPGLAAVYRSLADAGATLARVDAKPAFSLGESSPHPRIPPGPFEVVWTGLLQFYETAPVSFDAFVCGEVNLQVDGTTVLAGRGESEGARIGPAAALVRRPGVYRLAVRYRSLEGLPARLQIWWAGAGFAREPLPAWLLGHIPAELPQSVRDESLVAQGREAVGRLGCARCHRSAFPGVAEPPPGPSLANVGSRVKRTWLLDWLDRPDKLRPEARMPAVFSAERTGFVERWIVADFLLGLREPEKPAGADVPGDHRLGRRQFIGLGCATCHFLPDAAPSEQPDVGRGAGGPPAPSVNETAGEPPAPRLGSRTPLVGLADRFPAADLAAFLADPHTRYPDGRMPRLPVPPDVARNITAYLLLWSKPAVADDSNRRIQSGGPRAEEIDAIARRLGTRGLPDTAGALVREKRCAECHPGLEHVRPIASGQHPPSDDVPLVAAGDASGCLSGRTLPRFAIDPTTRQAIAAYRRVAARERHDSPFETRQRLLARLACARCHQRDSDRPPAIEEIGSTLGGAWLESVPYQRTPRLTNAHQQYTPSHLVAAVRDGVSGLRPARYTFRMPSFGDAAETVVQALAEADGELVADAQPPDQPAADPTLATQNGPLLVGFQGYSCVSCHVWDGQMLSEPDPGAVGPDLTKVTGRIRSEWFDRFLENPARSHPRTPMPAVFAKGQPASLRSVLDGDPTRQRDALWSYLALGTNAPSPKPPPPLPVTTPAVGEPAVVAQIPIRLPGVGNVESICLLTGEHDLVVYDVGAGTLHGVFVGAQILRGVQGRLRTFTASGTPIGTGFKVSPAWMLLGPDVKSEPVSLTFQGYDRLADGVRVRSDARGSAGNAQVSETLQVANSEATRRLVRTVRFAGVPAGWSIELKSRIPESVPVEVVAGTGDARTTRADEILTVRLTPDRTGTAEASLRYDLPAAQSPPAFVRTALADPGKIEGSLERPGYRAIAYPRPKTLSGEDLIMPSAVAVHPRDGRVFVASMKLGEIFVLHDPAEDGRSARFENYARGLFQEAYSMLAESDGLYVLHRRNLTKLVDADGDGVADRFDRMVALPQGVADTYDYAYGLVRDRTGNFVISYAQYADARLPGAGGAVRLASDGGSPTEIAFGFRNPLGWCVGPDGEIFFTDNQGEWVATNKLCHLAEGRFFGFPNPAQKQHTSKPPGKAAIWVPYGWARSINGVTYDNTGGKFGPFAGQVFMAELMFGGAIVRANLERVNGQYQGACFPFWGKGLLGPVTLAFSPRGSLFVGGITEPGWMAQPDRGALFRIDFTGDVPFEMQSIRVRGQGFRIAFTTPVSAATAADPASYHLEHYRYEYTGAYGSPELDRTRVAIERVAVSDDGRSVELTTGPLVKDRVYLISARGVQSADGNPLVHPTGAYTLNETGE